MRHGNADRFALVLENKYILYLFILGKLGETLLPEVDELADVFEGKLTEGRIVIGREEDYFALAVRGANLVKLCLNVVRNRRVLRKSGEVVVILVYVVMLGNIFLFTGLSEDRKDTNPWASAVCSVCVKQS